MLEMGLVQTNIARASQAKGAHSLPKSWPRSPDAEHTAGKILWSLATYELLARLHMAAVVVPTTSGEGHEILRKYTRPTPGRSGNLWWKNEF